MLFGHYLELRQHQTHHHCHHHHHCHLLPQPLHLPVRRHQGVLLPLLQSQSVHRLQPVKVPRLQLVRVLLSLLVHQPLHLPVRLNLHHLAPQNLLHLLVRLVLPPQVVLAFQHHLVHQPLYQPHQVHQGQCRLQEVHLNQFQLPYHHLVVNHLQGRDQVQLVPHTVRQEVFHHQRQQVQVAQYHFRKL